MPADGGHDKGARLMADFEAEIQRRNRAFESDDLVWAASQMPNASSPVVEMAFHKARLQCLDVSAAKRRESQAWLADRGIKNLFGEPVQRGAPLPQ